MGIQLTYWINEGRKEDELEEFKSTEQGNSGTIERSVNVLYNPGILEKLCRLKKNKVTYHFETMPAFDLLGLLCTMSKPGAADE